jgi:hypothetical protein
MLVSTRSDFDHQAASVTAVDRCTTTFSFMLVSLHRTEVAGAGIVHSVPVSDYFAYRIMAP